jgi:hypothetical protein
MLTSKHTSVPHVVISICSRPDLELEQLREEGLIEIHDGKDYVRYRRNLLEVFAVKFMDFVGSGGQVRGNMRIPVMYGDYRLFGPDTDELPCIVIDPFVRNNMFLVYPLACFPVPSTNVYPYLHHISCKF